MISGNLFARDFVETSIRDLDAYKSIADEQVDQLHEDLQALLRDFPSETNPNETQTEDDLIWPILAALGWDNVLRGQNLTKGGGRKDVPDGLLFLDSELKTKANDTSDESKRYRYGAAIVESKRWNRRLDRLSRTGSDVSTPSAQLMRYLSRVDVITDRALKWGVLTNGRVWRLYWQDAKSRQNDFFGIDLSELLGTADSETRRHGMRLLLLVFGRDSFAPTGTDGTTFHRRALEESRLYEARVAEDLSDKIFHNVFPRVVRAIAAAEPEADLTTVRDEALVLLYRLLFVLYAEDRDLLPVNDSRYDDYSLRNVRDNAKARLDMNDTFSSVASDYWNRFSDLCRVIDGGDTNLGLPPYNGGLFNRKNHKLLDTIRIPDDVMAQVIGDMGFELVNGERRYINYRDLSVRQLGSVYERLLEFEVVRDGDVIDIRPNIFARKGSGSYYTPDDLVELILEETLTPLVERARKTKDPAKAILDLKVCDPAMGSGHFLVSLVDWLSDKIGEAIEESEGSSALIERIEKTRATILEHAEDGNWSVRDDQLDDPQLIRRMVLKRCVYGVDKNPMAVELAKVSLWLHTFTVGAPLSFLDHHLKCGDSLFGLWVRDWKLLIPSEGQDLLAAELLREATRSEALMTLIENLADSDIDEVNQSKSLHTEMTDSVSDLAGVMSFAVALQLMSLSKDDKAIIQSLYDGDFGEPRHIMSGTRPPRKSAKNGGRAVELWTEARTIVDEEGFLHWQVAFPGVWQSWQAGKLDGGFDAVIGNPPWDRIKLQQVEWFAERRPSIASLPRASDRKAAIAKLKRDEDSLFIDFEKADTRTRALLKRARTKSRMAQLRLKGLKAERKELERQLAMAAERSASDRDKRESEISEQLRVNQEEHDLSGHIFSDAYHWLGRGDVNLYSIFVERAAQLIRPGGMVGLLVPSGIGSDKTAAPFFESIATTGRLRALYDFENRRTRYDAPSFFPDVDSRFKFCAFITSNEPDAAPAQCAFFLQDVSELADPDRCFTLGPEDFSRINPNTGTAPIFRTRRDLELTRRIYNHLPVLVDRSRGGEIKTWPVKYTRMFDMTNDSDRFRTLEELKSDEKAWPSGTQVWESLESKWVPLYEGKMVQAFDHRAADIVVNLENMNRPAQPLPAEDSQHEDTDWYPNPQYWISLDHVSAESTAKYHFSYKMITASTNMRTMISAVLPLAGIGNSMGALLNLVQDENLEAFLCANSNSIIYDFVLRQKIQGQNINWYIVEQLPVVPPTTYDTHRFGPKSAGEVVREAVLELTYTAHDMAPFARDMGYVDTEGEVRPPFIWDEDRRLRLRAKLDAVYFILYGITDPDDVAYIYSTFPIVERHERRDYDRYRSRDLALHWINALQAGRPDATIDG